MESRNLTRGDEVIADLAAMAADAPDAMPHREDDPTIEYGVDWTAPPGGAIPAPAARIGIGARIRGRYVLESVIGIGGTAIVYRARDVRRERGAPFAYVAVKIPRHGSSDSLEREFRVAQMLPHPNIVRVFDLDRIGDAWFMVTELLEGEPLAATVDRHAPGALPPTLAARVLRGCGAALQFAHERGIVHGDFKPGNVLVPQTGEPRVLDFGTAVAIAAGEGAAPADHTAPPAATRRYASPQVLAGERPEIRDDVFSFGCVAYEVLTGAHPFGQRSATEARVAGALPVQPAALGASQWQALSRALAWERESRPAGVAAVLEALGVRSGGVEHAAPALPLTRESSWLPAPVVATVIVALFGLSALLLWVSRDGARHPPAAGPAASSVAAAVGSAARPAPAPVAAAGVTAVGAALATPPVPQPAPAPPRGESGAARPAAGAAAAPAAAAAAQPLASPAEISFETELQTVSEGAAAAAVMLARTRGHGAVQVRWRTVEQTARSPGDYEAISAGVARFADGQTRRVLYIPLRPDALAEGNETFAIELYSPSRGARIAPIGVVTVRIEDDD